MFKMWRRQLADIKFVRSFSSKPYIGVDIGTTNIRVSVIDGGTVKVLAKLPAAFGRYENAVFMGSTANGFFLIHPPNVFSMIKPLIGRRFEDPVVQKLVKELPCKIMRGKNPKGWPWFVDGNGETDSPAEVLSYLMYNLKRNVASCIGESVSRAVISMPTSYDDDHNQTVVMSGRMVELVHQIGINEPTAAAIAYGLINKESLFAVVDLGGGSFDVSVLHVSNGHIKFRNPAKSDTSLNGKDFDNVLRDYLVSEFKRTDGIDLAEDKIALLMLGKAAEDAKIELSYAPQTEIIVPFIIANETGHKHLSITVTRSKFESLVTSLIEKTKSLCKSCLAEAGVSPRDLDEVLLVGGMARVPKLQEVVTEIFGKSPSTGVNPDEAVVVGAAASVHVGLFDENIWNDR